MTGCNQCGKCCFNHTILITFRDLREIHEFFPDFNLKEIITLFEPSEDYIDIEILKDNYPIINFEENNLIIRGYLGIKFQKDDDNQNFCPFFNKEKFNCKIHFNKPYICRVYPHKINLIWDGRCSESWTYSPPDDETMKKFIEDVVNTYKHFSEEVKEWNSDYSNKKIDDFIKFILINRRLQ